MATPRRVPLLVPAVLGAMLVAAAPADAQTGGDGPPPEHARFVRDSVLYPTTPDGWSCQFLGDCRPPGVRVPNDPGAIAVVPHGRDADVICVFGSYAKVTVTPGAPAVPGGPSAPAAPGGPVSAGEPPHDEPSRAPAPTPSPPAAAPAPAAGPSPAAPGAPTSAAPTTPPPTTPAVPPTTPAPRSSAAPATPATSPAGGPGPAPRSPDEGVSAAPVTAWAPVEDIETPAAGRPARCSIDQWAW